MRRKPKKEHIEEREQKKSVRKDRGTERQSTKSEREREREKEKGKDRGLHAYIGDIGLSSHVLGLLALRGSDMITGRR